VTVQVAENGNDFTVSWTEPAQEDSGKISAYKITGTGFESVELAKTANKALTSSGDIAFTGTGEVSVQVVSVTANGDLAALETVTFSRDQGYLVQFQKDSGTSGLTFPSYCRAWDAEILENNTQSICGVTFDSNGERITGLDLKEYGLTAMRKTSTNGGIAGLENLDSLNSFDISFNKISGEIPNPMKKSDNSTVAATGVNKQLLPVKRADEEEKEGFWASMSGANVKLDWVTNNNSEGIVKVFHSSKENQDSSEFTEITDFIESNCTAITGYDKCVLIPADKIPTTTGKHYFRTKTVFVDDNKESHYSQQGNFSYL
jgi:hypothetical protein